jgi:[acyl-carrier-protein] S-malonyltransferase
MKKVAFVFPGQGCQAVGMGRELYSAFPESRAVIDAAHDVLAPWVDLRRLLFEGPKEDLDRTANTQPAVLAVSMAAHEAFSTRLPGVRPVLVAGHSLGEYSALTAAGAIGLSDAMRVVRRRGMLMQEAVPEGVGAMAAVIGLDSRVVEDACLSLSGEEGGVVSAANFNSPAQTVVSGEREMVEQLTSRLRALGARRVLPLPVSAPFHCALMSPVTPVLEEVLGEIRLQAPTVPLVSNVEATPVSDPDLIRALLVKQVVSPVRWVEVVQALVAAGVTDVVELGPGKVLSGLVRGIDSGLACHHFGQPADLDVVIESLGGGEI